MTEPRPTYTAGNGDNGDNGNGDNGNGNGKCHDCDCDQYATRLLAACRRELRANQDNPARAMFLLGEIHALQVILDGPLDQRVIVPLVRPSPAEVYEIGATCSPDARHN